ncbi:MAG: N-acetylmuramoyl-L-alanine amidase [Planctomycetota bacterium]
MHRVNPLLRRALATILCAAMLAPTFFAAGCAVRPGTELERHGDEIMVAGRLFRIGTPVVLWTDPGGYDAYRVEARFKPWEESGPDQLADNVSPNRYNGRFNRFHNGVPDLSPEQFERVRGGGWTLQEVQELVDQFVIHYDVCGSSKFCFEVLHDHRHLSVHFMLDADGTLYQTLDLKERAWHAGQANSRSVGIEIAQIGAYDDPQDPVFDRWYPRDDNGEVRIRIPEDRLGNLDPDATLRPASNEPVVGEIHGRTLTQYDLTDAQYDALIKLTAALSEVLPQIALDAPRNAQGAVRNDVLTNEEFAAHKGLIGHYHLTTGKIDPGPAFDWERVLQGAKRELGR